jgi:DNA-directed RNA polymerase subunit M/transcription elongation factor TFIIS
MLTPLCGFAYARDLEEVLYRRCVQESTPYRACLCDFIENVERNPGLCTQFSPEELGGTPVRELMRGTPNHDAHQGMERTQKYYRDVLAEGEQGVKDMNNQMEVITCSRCKSGSHVAVELKQTRSADEGMSVFVRCEKCKARWRM